MHMLRLIAPGCHSQMAGRADAENPLGTGNLPQGMAGSDGILTRLHLATPHSDDGASPTIQAILILLSSRDWSIITAAVGWKRAGFLQRSSVRTISSHWRRGGVF
jgi:hypothetical protein